MKYFNRAIDRYLQEWSNETERKPLLLRGARQVGKSSAVRHLGATFRHFAEVNFEKHKGAKLFFDGDIDVRLIVSKLATYINVPIIAGETLLFLDEIQECPEAIMALRFFKEEYPELHVIAAGSLLEFTLRELPTFGVGRIHSLFMYPMTFDEFAEATGNSGLMDVRNQSDSHTPLDVPFHNKLVELLRIYLLVGGMPEAVAAWCETMDFGKCHKIHEDILLTYEDDFSKYKKRVDPQLLRTTMHGVCHQIGNVLSFSAISREHRSQQIREALSLLTLAGMVIPVSSCHGNELPLDAEANNLRAKYLFIDTGLMLTLLQLDGASSNQLIDLIMTGSPQDLVNKGRIAEMFAGLEMIRYKEPIQRQRLFFWEQSGKSIAEVDYIEALDAQVVPIEVKSSTQGGMKSLWEFMRQKNSSSAIRCSLENFGSFDYADTQADNAIRHVTICPLYAISQIWVKGSVWVKGSGT